MRKALALWFAALLVLTVGCTAGSGDVTIEVQKTASQIMDAVKFKDQMSEINQDTAIKLYGMEDGQVTTASVYESTGATAEEVAVFEAKDADTAGKVMDAAQKRIKDQKAGFQDYQPKEMEKLESPLLVQKGKYVILCVADNTAPAQKVIDEAG